MKKSRSVTLEAMDASDPGLVIASRASARIPGSTPHLTGQIYLLPTIEASARRDPESRGAATTEPSRITM